MCIKHGVKTNAEMASCHISGWGAFKKRLNPKAEKYRQKYIRLATK
jgi:hypothetical protein